MQACLDFSGHSHWNQVCDWKQLYGTLADVLVGCGSRQSFPEGCPFLYDEDQRDYENIPLPDWESRFPKIAQLTEGDSASTLIKKFMQVKCFSTVIPAAEIVARAAAFEKAAMAATVKSPEPRGRLAPILGTPVQSPKHPNDLFGHRLMFELLYGKLIYVTYMRRLIDEAMKSTLKCGMEFCIFLE